MITDPLYWVELAVNGLLVGGVYALVAVSMTVVFGVLRIVNFAHGSLVTVGMYASVVLAGAPFGLDPYAAILPGFVLFLVLGWVLYQGAMDAVVKRPMLTQLAFTLGLLVAIEALLEIVFLPDPRRVRAAWAASPIDLGSLTLSTPKTIAFAAAVVLALGFWAFLRWTWWGMAIRAVAQNPDAAQLAGIPRKRVLALAFALATAAAGLAGMLLAPFLTISPYVGSGILGAAFAAVVIGTEGNVLGAFLGGIFAGLAEALGIGLFGDEYKNACLFGVVLIMLLARPQGLFGSRAHA
jgi:branched-chain amino acid transport system permease protein